MTGQEIAAELKVHPDVMKIALREAGVEVLRGRNPKDYSEKEKEKIVKAVELVTAGWKHPKVAKKEKAVEKPEPKKAEKVPAKKPVKVTKPAVVEDDDEYDEPTKPAKVDPKKKLLNTKPPVEDDDDFDEEDDDMEEDDGEDDDLDEEDDDE